MLIQSSYKEGDILSFKTTAGEEFLATLTTDNMTSFQVSKPASIVVQDAGNGKISIDFQPTMFSMDINTTVDIMKSSVLMVTRARKDLKDAYIKSTSGIQPVGADVLNGLQSSSSQG